MCVTRAHLYLGEKVEVELAEEVGGGRTGNRDREGERLRVEEG